MGDKSRFLRFLNLPLHEKLFLVEALSICTGVWVILKFVQFRTLPGLFAGPPSTDMVANPEKLSSIRTAIRRASELFPARNRCLVSSLSGRLMLRRRKISSKIYLGMAAGPDGKIGAHAWISCGDFEVVAKKGNYTILYSF